MEIYRFDLQKYLQQPIQNENQAKKHWDIIHLVSVLQGLVNRDAPRLYLRAIQPADDFWWNWMSAHGEWLDGTEAIELGTIDELLEKFQSFYHGAVIYDPKVPATSNVASTIAGIENLLPIRYDTESDSLYMKLVGSGKIKPVKWLLNEDGTSIFTAEVKDAHSMKSSKANAYLWAKRNYLDEGLCNPCKLAYYLDTYWIKVPNIAGTQNHTLTNHDYFISNKAFFFDLGPWDDESPVDDPDQPEGTDAKVLRSILLSAYDQTKGQSMIHVGGFVPWAYKYTNHGIAGGKHDPVPSEWHYAMTLSAYNAYMDADALGLGAMANASFYQHYPVEPHYPQNSRPTVASLREKGWLDSDGHVIKKRFVTFYIGDYDSAAWLYAYIPSIWNDPKRGEMPLGWAFNPNLADRSSVAMVYTRKTSTPNDFFIAGDSGAGYVNPGMLQEPRAISDLPSGLEVWKDHCKRYYKQWDITITGFIIDGYAPGLDEDGMRTYADFSYDGIVAQKIEKQGVFEGMPFIRMNLDLDGNPEDVAKTIASRFEGDMPQFLIFRDILKTPSWHVDVRDHLRKIDPDAEIVDPYTFFALLKSYQQG
jgi:hypothetical protein